jgi:hypothetical protein
VTNFTREGGSAKRENKSIEFYCNYQCLILREDVFIFLLQKYSYGNTNMFLSSRKDSVVALGLPEELENPLSVGKEGDRALDRFGAFVAGAVHIDKSVEAVEAAVEVVGRVVEPQVSGLVLFYGNVLSLPGEGPQVIFLHKFFCGQPVEESSLSAVLEGIGARLVA